MIPKIFWLLATVAVALGAPLSQAADVRLRVSTKVLGNNRKADTRTTQRQLRIEIDNREREAYPGVTMEWTVIARDIRNRKLSIVSSGTRQIDIPANNEIEASSDPYSFSKTEGKVEEIVENRNRPDRPQYKVDPDSGTRYAGHIVVLTKDGLVIAESATAGMKKRVEKLKREKK